MQYQRGRRDARCSVYIVAMQPRHPFCQMRGLLGSDKVAIESVDHWDGRERVFEHDTADAIKFGIVVRPLRVSRTDVRFEETTVHRGKGMDFA